MPFDHLIAIDLKVICLTLYSASGQCISGTWIARENVQVEQRNS